MRKLICLILTTALLLTGCGETTTVSTAVKNIDILLNDTDVLRLPVPIDLVIVKTDNNHYWEFEGNIAIMRTLSTNSTAKYDKDLDVYISNKSVSRNFKDSSVLINAPKQYIDVFKNYLSQAQVITYDTALYYKKEVEELPKYTKQEMVLKDNMYMPDGCETNLFANYDAALHTNGKDWLQCFVVDGKFDQVKPKLMTLAQLNDAEVNIWFNNGDIFYVETANTIVAAKKLVYNCWYVYYGSMAYKDYILTGVHTVHKG